MPLGTIDGTLAEALGARREHLGALGRRMKGDKTTVVWQGPITPFHLLRGGEGVVSSLWIPSTVDSKRAKVYGCPIEEIDCDPDGVLLLLLLGGTPNPGMLSEFRERVDVVGEANNVDRAVDRFLCLMANNHLGKDPRALLDVAMIMLRQHCTLPSDPIDQACVIMRAMPTLIGAIARYCEGRGSFLYKPGKWSTTGNFFEAFADDAAEELALRFVTRYLLLLSTHSTNLSSSTARAIASGKGDAFLVCSGGLNALWTPAHGGAQALMQAMFDDLVAFAKLNPGDPLPAHSVLVNWIRSRVERGLDIDGVGHRMIKDNHDPRAYALRQVGESSPTISSNWMFQIFCALMDALPGVIGEAAPKITMKHVNVDFIAGPMQPMILDIKNSANFVLLFALARYLDYLAAMIHNAWLGGAIVRPDSVDEDELLAMMGTHLAGAAR